ncbi:titin-like [Rana temporaria]|uniref:titin-like n=1 Tax=Rana temporaria TaxID=8407 RepID=UPI001AADA6DB|nr:titin-like [Rana temporaria]
MDIKRRVHKEPKFSTCFAPGGASSGDDSIAFNYVLEVKREYECSCANNMSPLGVSGKPKKRLKVFVLSTLFILNHKTAMMVQSAALIVFISTILGHTGSAVSPVVTFTPNWGKIFRGESITMTCDVGITRGRRLIYVWYQDGTKRHTGKIYTIGSANTWNSGNYRCRANTESSDTARLDVVDDEVILRVPLYVYEGDDLTLRCHHRSGYLGKFSSFYKDNVVIQSWTDTPEYHVGIANTMSIGKYKCIKGVTWNTYEYSKAEIFLSIKNLFEIPEIKVTPYPVVEGDEMTLTCDTSLSSLRPRTQLKFAFHKDGRNVREFTSYNQYGVQSAQVKDSGKYSCEVTTATNSVRKRSQEILVKINELFFTPVLNVSTLEVLEGDTMTMKCDTSLSPPRQRTELHFAFYRDGRNVQNFNSSDQYGVQSTELEDSGNYSCEVRSASNISKKSEAVFVQIRELFEIPEIKVTPYLVVEGDGMTLTCDTSLSPLRPRTQLKFAFHKDGRNVGEFTSYNQYGVQSAQVKDSGNYSCEVTTATNSVRKRSQEILVEIKELFVNPRIIIMPNPTIEGDNMTLICITRLTRLRQSTELQFAFYRDGRIVQEFSLSDQYEVQSTELEDSGNYSCDVSASNGKVRKSSHITPITIKELFVTPVLNVSTFEVLKGDMVTLTCDTSLSALSQRTQLEFAFYRDGRNVQEFSLSDQYGVQSTQLEDSGNYSCEVRSASNISKKSEDVFVQIRDLFEIPEIKVTPYPAVEGDEMTLTCDTSLSPLRPRTQLKFAFHKDGRNVEESTSYNQYGVQSAQVKDSGKYSCEVSTATNSVRKRSQEMLVKINELFFTPVINISTFEVLKGDNVTLTCNPSLSPLRQRTELQFAFYRDGRNVQEFSLYNHYGIRFAQLEDSGNYFCEVRSTFNISKRSDNVLVQIRGKKDADYTLQNIIRLLASGIIILIGAFIFYSHMKTVRISKTKNVEDAKERVEEHQL